MKSNIWAKTLLTTYRYFERMAGAIDKMVDTRAMNSMCMSGADYSTNNVLSLSEKIIELSERKVKIINLKILVENSLDRCGDSFARILIGKYIDGAKNIELCEKFGLPYRTYFRRLSDAERRFESAMSTLGFNSEKLESYLSSEKWILFAKDKILASQTDEVEFKESSLDRLAAS